MAWIRTVGEKDAEGLLARLYGAAVARAFGVRARDVAIVTGERSRTKVLEVAVPDDASARARLAELLDE